MVAEGWWPEHGATFTPVNITDIAPTLAAILCIMEPNGCQGKVIERVIEGN